ncbi:MAG: hypothetical protein JRJ59_02565 [Deltaproteobacteria bacterium]|nr:hypothetical protein [Deltaproteobacteria bacterium]
MGRLTSALFGLTEGREGQDHPSLEDLARLAEGRVEPLERAALVRHLNRCRRCYQIVAQTMADLAADQTVQAARPRRLRWLGYAVAASVVAVMLVGGGLFYDRQGQAPAVVTASLNLDENLKSVLLENESTTWQKEERIERLVKLLQDRGVKTGQVEKVVLVAAYMPAKSLLAPEEILKVRIKDGVAYLEVVEKEEEGVK